MDLNNTQRRFSVMGENTFLIANKIMKNQRICRLLKYQTKDPFAEEINGKSQPDVDGVDLINKQILITPKIYDDSTEKMSYITAIFDDFVVNQLNPEFKVSTVRFDIACPYDEWILNNQSLRPFLIMQELDIMFNTSFALSTATSITNLIDFSNSILNRRNIFIGIVKTLST